MTHSLFTHKRAGLRTLGELLVQKELKGMGNKLGQLVVSVAMRGVPSCRQERHSRSGGRHAPAPWGPIFRRWGGGVDLRGLMHRQGRLHSMPRTLRSGSRPLKSFCRKPCFCDAEITDTGQKLERITFFPLSISEVCKAWRSSRWIRSYPDLYPLTLDITYPFSEGEGNHSLQ